jgi:Reverse transcriptase (RNA-dependent DNA polymerase)
VRRIIKQIARPKAIRWAIRSFKPFKLPGPDLIFPALLQEGINCIVETLTKIFEFCLLHGYIPLKWRETKVIFIPKPGRVNYEDPKNHRGISLSSFMLKTLKRLVDRYVRTRVLHANPLRENQFAYQRGKSTITATHKLSNAVEAAFETNESVLAVFLDIEGAFDRASFDSFESAAERLEFEPFVTKWIKNLLRNRIITAEMHGVKVRKIPEMGCPQGGVLSPLIWLIIADDS